MLFPAQYTRTSCSVFCAANALFLSCVSPLAGELALASPESVSEHLDVLFPKLIEVSEILEIW